MKIGKFIIEPYQNIQFIKNYLNGKLMIIPTQKIGRQTLSLPLSPSLKKS